MTEKNIQSIYLANKEISTKMKNSQYNIFYIYPYFYIFCRILSTQLETRKIDLHKTCEKNLSKVNYLELLIWM